MINGTMNSNGNGNGQTKGGHLQLRDIAPQIPEEKTFQASLREAMFDGVTTGDAKEIVQSIVASAKSGDKQSQKMFFDYLCGAQDKPQNVTVNVVADVETAARIAAEQSRKGRANDDA